jgi:hypothetical protein
MEFFKYFDVFSIKFKFYTNNQPNYQNIFGGIMTFSYILLCIPIIIVLTYDDIKRLNPTTTTSEITSSERKIINMHKEKVWIPFRMVNYENKFIDHRGILYIAPYLIIGTFNNEIGMDLKYHLLKYKLCNETSMVNKPYNYKIDTPLNELFCFERDDILFGGNWNHDYLYYIEINLYLCEDGIAYNKSDPRCSKLDDYLSTLNSSLLIDFYYPMVQFQPNNLETPFEIIYKNYYYRLTSFSYKVQKLYLKEHIISDDQHFIKTNYKNTSCWGMSLLYSDDYFLPSEFDAISDNSNNSRIYALNIYMDDGLLIYTRSFKKLFLMISNVFPWLRILFFFMKKNTQHIKMSITKRKLMELIFEDKKALKYKKILKLKDSNNNNNKNNIVNIISNKSENELMKDKDIDKSNNFRALNDDLNYHKNLTKFLNEHNNNILINDNYDFEDNCNKNSANYLKEYKFNNFISNKNLSLNRLNFSLYNKNQNKKSYEKDNFSFINIKNHKSFSFDDTIRKNNKNNTFQHKKKTRIFPYFYFLLDILFDNLINPKKFFCISKNYFLLYNFMCKVYDISTHILFFKQFNLINKFFKNKKIEENEINKSLFSKRININNNQVMNKIDADLNKISNYDIFL